VLTRPAGHVQRPVRQSWSLVLGGSALSDSRVGAGAAALPGASGHPQRHLLPLSCPAAHLRSPVLCLCLSQETLSCSCSAICQLSWCPRSFRLQRVRVTSLGLRLRSGRGVGFRAAFFVRAPGCASTEGPSSVHRGARASGSRGSGRCVSLARSCWGRGGSRGTAVAAAPQALAAVLVSALLV